MSARTAQTVSIEGGCEGGGRGMRGLQTFYIFLYTANPIFLTDLYFSDLETCHEKIGPSHNWPPGPLLAAKNGPGGPVVAAKSGQGGHFWLLRARARTCTYMLHVCTAARAADRFWEGGTTVGSTVQFLCDRPTRI